MNDISKSIELLKEFGAPLNNEGCSSRELEALNRLIRLSLPIDFLEFQKMHSGYLKWEFDATTISVWSIERVVNAFKEDLIVPICQRWIPNDFIPIADYCFDSYHWLMCLTTGKIFLDFSGKKNVDGYFEVASNYADFLNRIVSEDKGLHNL